MTITKFKLKYGNFELEMEGEQEYVDKKFSEVTERLLKQEIPISISAPTESAGPVVTRQPLAKSDLQEIIEYDSQGKPHLTISNPTTRLSLSEVMALFLYVYEPQKLSMQDLKTTASENWRTVEITSVSAVMATTLKGKVIKEGTRGKFIYSLSGEGRNYVKNIITKLKQEGGGKK